MKVREAAGRGFTVHPRWLAFEDFIADIGPMPRPFRAHYLDRVDFYAGWVPGNVRWVTRRNTVRTRRSSVTVLFHGTPYNIAELARLLRIPPQWVYQRRADGWPEDYWFLPARSRGGVHAQP